MLIKTEVEIPPRRIADLMVIAIEGGIGYWCKSVRLKDDEVEHKPWYDCEAIYGWAGLHIEVIDEDDKTYLIGLKEMERAFKLMQTFGKGHSEGYCWRDFISENEDATTADVWFQLAVFGEVVYG